MAAGKNKLLRYSRIYVDGYNLSGDSRTFSSLENSFGEVDISGWSDSVQNFIRDQVRTAGILGYQAILNDTETTGAFTVLKDAGSHNVALLIGGGGVPAIGDIAYVMRAQQFGDVASFDAKLGVFQADFKPLSGYGYAPLGKALATGTAITITTEHTAVNNGAASTNGWMAQLHILATSSGDYAFKIEDSADNETWGDLTDAVFTIDGSTIASETIVAATGTVKQYIRLTATRTAGGCTPVCVFSRN